MSNAASALFKLLRFSCRGGGVGIKALLHLDDGIGTMQEQTEAQRAADVVRADLAQFSLMTRASARGL